MATKGEGRKKREEDDSVPEEIEETCVEVHDALAAVDRVLKPALAISRTNLEERLDELDAASLTLLLAYTMNSLFWVYLTTQGVNPKAHPVKKELERLQKAMGRAKLLNQQRKGREMKVDSGAAKRLVKGALWDIKSYKRKRDEEAEKGAELPDNKRAAKQ